MHTCTKSYISTHTHIYIYIYIYIFYITNHIQHTHSKATLSTPANEIMTGDEVTHGVQLNGETADKKSEKDFNDMISLMLISFSLGFRFLFMASSSNL